MKHYLPAFLVPTLILLVLVSCSVQSPMEATESPDTAGLSSPPTLLPLPTTLAPTTSSPPTAAPPSPAVAPITTPLPTETPVELLCPPKRLWNRRQPPSRLPLLCPPKRLWNRRQPPSRLPLLCPPKRLWNRRQPPSRLPHRNQQRLLVFVVGPMLLDKTLILALTSA